MDHLSPDERSHRMALVRSKNTKPELAARRLLFHLGYRFRLHSADLPGKPDIVFRKRRKVIFVHGCFWHRHQGCRLTTTPVSREGFWREKFKRTVERDQRAIDRLSELGWSVLVVWECQLKHPDTLTQALGEFLGKPLATGIEPAVRMRRL